jgi:hypothetical protein
MRGQKDGPKDEIHQEAKKTHEPTDRRKDCSACVRADHRMSQERNTMTTTADIAKEIVQERVKQDNKWGPQNHSLPVWIAILAEEFGEASMEVNDWFHPSAKCNGSQAAIRNELIQTAAVCVAMIEQIDNGQANVTSEPQ